MAIEFSFKRGTIQLKAGIEVCQPERGYGNVAVLLKSVTPFKSQLLKNSVYYLFDENFLFDGKSIRKEKGTVKDKN
jgi:hypothetical protein